MEGDVNKPRHCHVTSGSVSALPMEPSGVCSQKQQSDSNGGGLTDRVCKSACRFLIPQWNWMVVFDSDR